MPTAVELNQLTALLSALTPLTTKSSGELITAEDWNTLASTVATIAQVVIAGGPDIVPPHDHAGAVGLSWLDPGLRAIVQGGGLADPAQDARLGAVERATSGLEGKFHRTDDLISQLQSAAGQASADSLLHQGRLTAIDATVSGLADARTDVANVRTTLASLQTSVATAVQAASGLQVGGQPIGVVVSSLLDRTAAVEGAQRTNDATLKQVSAATTDVVTNEQLKTALGSVQATLSDADRQALTQSIATDLQSSINTTVASATGQLQDQLNKQFAGVDAKVSAAVAGATSSLSDDIVARIQPQIATAVSQSQASTLASVQTQIATAVSASAATLQQNIDTLQASTAQTVSTEVSRQLGGTLSDIQSHLAAVDTQLTRVGQRLDGEDGQISAINQQIVKIPLDEAGNRQLLHDQLQGEIDQNQQADSTALQTGLAGLRSDLQASVNTSIANLNSSLQNQIASTNASVTTQIQQASDALRSQMATVADQRIAIGRQQLLTDVNTHVVNVLQNRMPQQ
jgi:hypothetical protein